MFRRGWDIEEAIRGGASVPEHVKTRMDALRDRGKQLALSHSKNWRLFKYFLEC